MEIISCVFLLVAAACRPAAACAAATEAGKTTSADTLFLCRECGHELAFSSDTIGTVHSRMALSGRNHTLPGGRRIRIQTFENPHGLQFEVVTFRRADVDKRWPAERHFSWFPGFSWTVALCPQCRAHLAGTFLRIKQHFLAVTKQFCLQGWAFQPSSWPATITSSAFESSDQTFLALIVKRLLSEDFASSLLITPKSFIS